MNASIDERKLERSCLQSSSLAYFLGGVSILMFPVVGTPAWKMILDEKEDAASPRWSGVREPGDHKGCKLCSLRNR